MTTAAVSQARNRAQVSAQEVLGAWFDAESRIVIATRSAPQPDRRANRPAATLEVFLADLRRNRQKARERAALRPRLRSIIRLSGAGEADLWVEFLDEHARHDVVRWVWVRGHVGHPYNERCHALAVERCKEAILGCWARKRRVDLARIHRLGRLAGRGSVRLAGLNDLLSRVFPGCVRSRGPASGGHLDGAGRGGGCSGPIVGRVR
jgi:hypothetical protein